jgi:hypothetical protein
MTVDYGYEIVTQTTTCTENVESTITASAPTGKVAVGGGWLSAYPADHVAVGDSYPDSAGAGWSVRVKLLGNTGIMPAPSKDVTVYAVCVDAS